MEHSTVNTGLFLIAILVSQALHAGETANKYGITMVDIPSGSFLMGSCKITEGMKEENKKRAFLGQTPISENCNNGDDTGVPDDRETPQHRVDVKAFQMSKTEVTLGQFKRFIVESNSNELIGDFFMKHNIHGDDAPVVGVSWHAAMAFTHWLNKVDGPGYRLPSEAEWEYACRAGGAHKYCGGNNLNELGWHEEKHHRAVGGKRANIWGLHDMSGNVWEWVSDCRNDRYTRSFYTSDNPPTDGSSWGRGQCDQRVVRGGSATEKAAESRAANRKFAEPDSSYSGLGFRVARTP